MKRLSALNFKINAQFGKENLPDWIMLIPGDGKVEGRDGRFFTNPNPIGVIARTLNNGMDLPIDIDHAVEYKDEAPAYGWIKELELRNNAIWGRVEWTYAGAWKVDDKEYRYISPVFEYIPISDDPKNPDYHNGEIQMITSVALTNRPNLKLPALNSRNPQIEKESKMDLAKWAAMLGLPSSATEAEILAAVAEAKAAKDAQDAEQKADTPKNEEAEPPKDAPAKGDAEPTAPAEPEPEAQPAANSKDFVSRKEYNDIVKQLAEAQIAINHLKAGQSESQIATMVDTAAKDGKIAPNQRKFWLDIGESFGADYLAERIGELKPLVATAANRKLEKSPNNKSTNALADDEAKTAQKLGLTAEEFNQAKENK